jgi:hypothetical protein
MRPAILLRIADPTPAASAQEMAEWDRNENNLPCIVRTNLQRSSCDDRSDHI